MNTNNTEIMAGVTMLREQRQTIATAAFSKLVKDSVDGKKITPERVLETLDTAGKSDADYLEAQQTYSARVADAALVTREPETTSKIQRLQIEVDEANKVLQAAQLAHTAIVAPINTTLEELQATLKLIDNAKSRLQSNCTDATLVAEKDEAEARENELHREIRRLNAVVYSAIAAEKVLMELNTELGQKPIESESYADSQRRSRAIKTIAEAKEAEKLLVKNREELRQLPSRSEAVRQKMLAP